MATFSITPGMGQGEIVGAINYLLANIGQGLQVNAGNGIITIPNNNVPFSYAYPYLYIAFANSFDGTVDFDQHSYTNKQYYGLWNTATLTTGGSSNPAQYVWYKVANGGFGATKSLFYSVSGNYHIEFSISENIPSATDYLWRQYDPVNFGIDLTYITNATNVNVSAGGVIPNTSLGYVFIQGPNGGEWQQLNNSLASEVYVNPIYPPATYYLALTENISNYSLVDSDTQLIYNTYTTATNNTLVSPNVTINSVLNLTPLNAAPGVFGVGSIVVANRTSWDPAGIGSGPAYVAFYNGSNWVKLG